MASSEVRVPDIGDFADVPVIEILVSVGDSVSAEQPLVTLESDKATMDVPAPFDGTVESVSVSVGDTVSEGTVIATLAGADANTGGADDGKSAEHAVEETPANTAAPAVDASAGGSETDVAVPDIGDFSNVPVIELLVAIGDTVSEEQPLVTLESDKATMDVPAPVAGEIVALEVSVGDEVSQGTLVARIRSVGGAVSLGEQAKEVAPAQHDATPVAEPSPAPSPAPDAAGGIPDPRAPVGRPSPTADMSEGPSAGARFHATPAVRRFARELGVDLAGVNGTGRKGRITKEDVTAYVKGVMTGGGATPAQAAAPSGAGIPSIKLPDFSQFGPTEKVELGRIQKISGPHLTRAWLNVPHVTQHDSADITEMEAFRKSLKDEAAKRGVKLTPLVFMMKAVVAAMKAHPNFNASLSEDGTHLIVKGYYNIGIAVDTPNGLVVPVVRAVDEKGLYDLAEELGDISARARDGKLGPKDMSGGCMSISSLGGIGGTAFTPIVNAPEVAILGVARSQMEPKWDGSNFVPRLMLPLSLSYDHRVIDGAEGARFITRVSSLLGDVRRLLL